MGLTATPKKTTLTVPNWTMDKCQGVVNDVAVTFGGLKTNVNFLVVEDVPVKVLKEIAEIERFRAQIDLGPVLRLHHQQKVRTSRR